MVLQKVTSDLASYGTGKGADVIAYEANMLKPCSLRFYAEGVCEIQPRVASNPGTMILK
jgi:hypothetical protein